MAGQSGPERGMATVAWGAALRVSVSPHGDADAAQAEIEGEDDRGRGSSARQA